MHYIALSLQTRSHDPRENADALGANFARRAYDTTRRSFVMMSLAATLDGRQMSPRRALWARRFFCQLTFSFLLFLACATMLFALLRLSIHACVHVCMHAQRCEASPISKLAPKKCCRNCPQNLGNGSMGLGLEATRNTAQRDSLKFWATCFGR